MIPPSGHQLSNLLVGSFSDSALAFALSSPCNTTAASKQSSGWLWFRRNGAGAKSMGKLQLPCWQLCNLLLSILLVRTVLYLYLYRPGLAGHHMTGRIRATMSLSVGVETREPYDAAVTAVTCLLNSLQCNDQCCWSSSMHASSAAHVPSACCATAVSVAI